MIRSGNHFIRVDFKWLLIDGPWFKTLERLSNHCRHDRVRIPAPLPLSLYMIDPPPETVYIPAKYLEWQRTSWDWRILGYIEYPSREAIMAWAGRFGHRPKYFAYNELCMKRYRVAWKTTDGRLPAHLYSLGADEYDYQS